MPSRSDQPAARTSAASASAAGSGPPPGPPSAAQTARSRSATNAGPAPVRAAVAEVPAVVRQQPAQREQAGHPVRHLPVRGQPAGERLHRAGPGGVHRPPGPGRRGGQLVALPPGRRVQRRGQRGDQVAGRLPGQRPGLRGGPGAPVRLDRVRERVERRRVGHRGRAGVGQPRVDDRHVREQRGMVDRPPLPAGADRGEPGHLGAAAAGGGHQHQPRRVLAQLRARLRRRVGQHPAELGGVQRRAAAERRRPRPGGTVRAAGPARPPAASAGWPGPSRTRSPRRRRAGRAWTRWPPPAGCRPAAPAPAATRTAPPATGPIEPGPATRTGRPGSTGAGMDRLFSGASGRDSADRQSVGDHRPALPTAA